MQQRFSFVHVVVAAALSAATVATIGLVQAVSAAGPATPSTFVPIVPCRLADTRPGDSQVGERATPIGTADTASFKVTGVNGECVIPSTATGIAANVTAVNATAPSYMTIFPSDAVPMPTASNLNYSAGSPPLPNQVTVQLSVAGAISAFNANGSVDVIIDVVGYYQPARIPVVTSGTVLLTDSDFKPGFFQYDVGVGVSSYPARVATIEVPALTDQVLENGSVEVVMMPNPADLMWTGFPFRFDSGAGWAEQYDMRYNLGAVRIYYWIPVTDIDNVMLPPPGSVTIPDINIRWVIRPA